MSKILVCSLLYIFGVLISAFAQILLKKSAKREHNNMVKEYLNLNTIVGYILFFGATICTLFAYKYIPLSFGPILGATEYIFIAVLAKLILKEKISNQRLVGLIIIIIGIIITVAL